MKEIKIKKARAAHYCLHENMLGMIKERLESQGADIREVKDDVKSLLAFKWQLLGAGVLVSALVSALIGLIR